LTSIYTAKEEGEGEGEREGDGVNEHVVAVADDFIPPTATVSREL
jgi:hypothetical protein